MDQFWDLRYEAGEYVYGTRPNQFFREILKGQKPGRLLLAGEGEGRNAVYAASLGWDVYAFDISKVARNKALELAFLRGVSIHYQVCSWQDFRSGQDAFDLAGIFYLHLPGPDRRFFHRRLIHWVRPGGRIVAELFSRGQNGRLSGGPGNPDLLYSKEDLRNDFHLTNIKTLREREVDLDEGRFHHGKAKVVRLIADRV